MTSLVLLIVSLVLISLLFTLANAIAWYLFERPRHALVWAVAFGLAALQYGLNLARGAGLVPEIPFWLLANSVSFVLVSCALWGHRLRLQLPTPPRLLLALVGGLVLLNAAIVLWVEAPGPKVALAPAYTFIAMTSIAWSLLLHRRSDRLPQYLAALVHFLFGLTQVAAAGIALSFGDEATPQMQRNYQLANFALMPSLFVAMGVSVLLLLATDLSYRLRTQALTDDLTGLSNRRGFLAGSERMLARAERAGLPVSVICCDLDYFKRVNDRHGHAAGDRALRHVAAVLTQRMRKGDEAGRLGGEEFAICLEGMDSAQAAAAVERIRRALRDTPLVVDGREIAVTASFGIASRQEGEAFERMLLRADQALYAAKEAGRDALRVSDAAGLSNEPPAAV